jgi:hypothetical protein
MPVRLAPMLNLNPEKLSGSLSLLTIQRFNVSTANIALRRLLLALVLQRGLNLFENGFEGDFIVHREIGENFAIQ